MCSVAIGNWNSIVIVGIYLNKVDNQATHQFTKEEMWQVYDLKNWYVYYIPSIHQDNLKDSSLTVQLMKNNLFRIADDQSTFFVIDMSLQ